MWAGSDDGLVHLSRDNGKTWSNITPPAMPERGTVNMIDLSAHEPGRAFLAVQRYREDDFRPYVFRTEDFGASWSLLTDGNNGIPARHFVRVVREDPDQKGLLYAGTEFGMYLSFDDGAHWQPFQLNLPITPITDLMVHRKDLLVATQGRSFYILDDLSPLHQLNDGVSKSPIHLFAPRPTYRAPGFAAEISAYFADTPGEPVILEILDSRGAVIRSFSTRPSRDQAQASPAAAGGSGRSAGQSPISIRPGLNRLTWNLAHNAIFSIPPGIVMWGGAGGGPKAVPGSYQVRLRSGATTQTQPLQILKDPRNPTTEAEYQEQLDLCLQIGGKIKELYDNLSMLRDVRSQANELAQRLERGGFGSEANAAARTLATKLTTIEGELTQLQGEGGQDALNFPGRHDNQWTKLYSEVSGPDGKVTAGAKQRFEDLKPVLAKHMEQLRQVLTADLAAFNKVVRDKGAPAVIVGSARAKK